MRIVLLASVSILTLSGIAFAQTSVKSAFPAVCTQVVQPAVSPRGECVYFPTPCDVPDGYRPISSCDLVEPVDRGTSLEDRLRRRSASFNAVRPKEVESVESTESTDRPLSKQYRFGSGSMTRDEERTKELSSSNNPRRAGIRTFTMPDYDNRAAKARYIQHNPKKSALQYDANWQLPTGYYQPRAHSQDSTDRSGYISNQPRWSDIIKARADRVGARRYTQPYLEEREKNTTGDATQEVRLRRVYRGERKEGSLRGEDMTQE